MDTSFAWGLPLYRCQVYCQAVVEGLLCFRPFSPGLHKCRHEVLWVKWQAMVTCDHEA